jgi:hypothetical protein
MATITLETLCDIRKNLARRLSQIEHNLNNPDCNYLVYQLAVVEYRIEVATGARETVPS